MFDFHELAGQLREELCATGGVSRAVVLVVDHQGNHRLDVNYSASPAAKTAAQQIFGRYRAIGVTIVDVYVVTPAK